MTIKQLIETLESYENPEAHITIAVVPDRLLQIEPKGMRLELQDTWFDRWGVCNLIAIEEASKVDPALRRENGLEEA
jgi:hypothetical protein